MSLILLRIFGDTKSPEISVNLKVNTCIFLPIVSFLSNKILVLQPVFNQYNV